MNTVRTIYTVGNYKVCYSSEWQEYQVGLASVPNRELADHKWTYFTNDKQDAIYNCRLMSLTHGSLEA